MQNATAASSARGWEAAAACALAALVALAQPEVWAQGLYKCVESGVTVYSDAPCMSSTASRHDGEQLTQRQVLALIEAVDRAGARMDWEGQAAYLADDAVIDVRIKSSRRPGRATVSKTQYRRLVDEARHKISNYSLRRDEVRVSVHPNGHRADVESKVSERWLDPGGAMMSTSRERWVVESRAGKPRITILDIVTGEPQPQPLR